jgi:RNA polymerase sigma-70 factor (ECF subfamily)
MHGAALVLVARQYVPSASDAEDVVQEAFVRFWRSREKVQQAEAFLYVCVKRVALDWQRSRRRASRREQQVARSEHEPMFANGPDDAERRAAIEAALAELPADQAEVLVMKIWGGLTFEQIGGALDVSPNTVASRYRYALAKLREVLKKEPLYE